MRKPYPLKSPYQISQYQALTHSFAHLNSITSTLLNGNHQSDVDYTPSGLFKIPSCNCVELFWHLLHVPVWQTSPVWHPCRRKQSTTCINIPLATCSLFFPSHTQIYLHYVDIFVQWIDHICVSIQPYLHRNVHVKTHHHFHGIYVFQKASHTHFIHTLNVLWLLAERQKHSTELVIYCLYNWYVWIKKQWDEFYLL